MPDYYHAPALILTALLLPAFGYLYLRFRNTRTLMWFLGFLFVLLFMGLVYPGDPFSHIHPWLAAIGQTSMQISAAMFLGSLSPLYFRVKRFRILFVVPYTLVLIAYSILLYGVFGGITPSGPVFLIFPLLAAMCFGIGVFWGMTKGAVPAWVGASFSGVLGSLAVWACFVQGPERALTLIESINLQMAAVLLLFVFRRFSPGVFLSVAGFATWSLTFLCMFPWVAEHSFVYLYLGRAVVLAKVIAAMGMILLTLEDELDRKKVAQDHERQIRRQLEAFAGLILTRRRVEEFDCQGAEICDTVVIHSRFAQAALLLESGGRFRLAGSAGLDPAVAQALGALAERIPVAGFLEPGTAPPAAHGSSQTLHLDLTPWLIPGDDLERLHLTSVLAVPLMGRSSAQGALLLASMRSAGGGSPAADDDAARADDLLPIEMLAARIQAMRSQTMLFEKLIDSEKYAGLGQLAGNVTQQLNNPLTVILGYATLLQESAAFDEQDRRAVDSIVSESRRIRATLESLSRVSYERGDLPAAVSVTELLADMEQLYRSEFLQRSIEFHVNVSPGLPRILCGAQQLRQAVLHCLQYAMHAVENEHESIAQDGPRTIRLEAGREGNLVQISVSHSGPGFQNPDHVFDPYVPSQADEEMAGVGLSMCASILRDQNGRASAVNLEPRGAAIILELKAA